MVFNRPIVFSKVDIEGVDTGSGFDDDFLPFRDVINEYYAKDISRKIKSTFKAKGESGKHVASSPPYGYLKDISGGAADKKSQRPKNWKKCARKDKLHHNYLKRKANGKQKEYEERMKAKKKAQIDNQKEQIRAEDGRKGYDSDGYSLFCYGNYRSR